MAEANKMLEADVSMLKLARVTEANEKLAKAIGVWIRTEFPPLLGNLWVNVTFYISRLSNNKGGCEMGLLTRLHNTMTPMTHTDCIL